MKVNIYIYLIFILTVINLIIYSSIYWCFSILPLLICLLTYVCCILYISIFKLSKFNISFLSIFFVIYLLNLVKFTVCNISGRISNRDTFDRTFCIIPIILTVLQQIMHHFIPIILLFTHSKGGITELFKPGFSKTWVLL